MPSRYPTTRRALLASLGAAGLGSLAGCATVDRLRHRRWSSDVPGRPLAAPVLAGGQVIVHSEREDGSGQLAAVGRGSGEQVWVADVPAGEHALAATDGTVLVGGESLVGLGVASGERRFRTEVGVSDEGSFDRLAVDTDADGFLVAQPEGGLLALTPDGEERWRSNVPVGPPVAGGLITNAGVELPTDDEDGVTLVGFRADSGAERWRVELDEDWTRLGGVTASSNAVHVAGEDVHSFAAADGEVRLGADLGRDEVAATPPVLSPDNRGGFYVGTGVPWVDGEYGTIYPFGAPPTEGFEYRTETTVRELATGGPERLFAAVGETVHAVDLVSMTADWRVDLDARWLIAAGGICYGLVGGGRSSRLVALADG